METLRPYTTLEESALLQRIAKGDEKAFQIIYNLYKQKIYTVAFKILKSESLAEDILHEVFLNIWKLTPENLHNIQHLNSYLRTATTNQALKIIRKAKIQLQFHQDTAYQWTEAQQETEEHIFMKDTEKLLGEAIDQLPPQQKLVFTLCKEEGLKYAEVAERLHLSQLTVKTHMQHALRFLKRYLHAHTDLSILILVLECWHKK